MIGLPFCSLRHFTNAWSAFSIRHKVVFIIFMWILFSFLYLPMLLYAFFFCNICTWCFLREIRILLIICYWLFVICYWLFIDYLSHFLELNYWGLNLNFLKLAQLLIDRVIESNSGPMQNGFFKSPHGHPTKRIKEHQKSLTFVRTVILMLLIIQRYKMFSSVQLNLSA